MKPYTLAIGLAMVGLVGCRTRPTPPGWMQVVPSQARSGISGNLGWMLQQPLFMQAMAKVPAAEQALDLFLRRARIHPGQETGRISFFLVGDLPTLGQAPEGGLRAAETASQNFLVCLSGFRDPRALMSALADAFPVEGSLSMAGREYPLHVILDVNGVHLRALMDDRGQVWLGDLRALATLVRADQAPAHLAKAGAWLTASSPFQGFADLKGVDLRRLAGQAGSLPIDLPEGLEALAFSLSPQEGGAQRMELVLSGRPEAVRTTLPWLQRVVSAAAAVQGRSQASMDMIHEKERVVLRCTMSADQVTELLGALHPQLRRRG